MVVAEASGVERATVTKIDTCGVSVGPSAETDEQPTPQKWGPVGETKMSVFETTKVVRMKITRNLAPFMNPSVPQFDGLEPSENGKSGGLRVTARPHIL